MVSLFGFASYFLFCFLVIPTMSQMSGMGLGLQAAQSGQVKPAIWTNGQSYSLGVGVPIINNGINRPSVGIGASVGGNFKGGSKPNYNVGIGVNIPIGNMARPPIRRRN